MRGDLPPSRQAWAVKDRTMSSVPSRGCWRFFTICGSRLALAVSVRVDLKQANLGELGLGQGPVAMFSPSQVLCLSCPGCSMFSAFRVVTRIAFVRPVKWYGPGEW
jgi:hypothetical protein